MFSCRYRTVYFKRDCYKGIIANFQLNCQHQKYFVYESKKKSQFSHNCEPMLGSFTKKFRKSWWLTRRGDPKTCLIAPSSTHGSNPTVPLWKPMDTDSTFLRAEIWFHFASIAPSVELSRGMSALCSCSFYPSLNSNWGTLAKASYFKLVVWRPFQSNKKVGQNFLCR